MKSNPSNIIRVVSHKFKNLQITRSCDLPYQSYSDLAEEIVGGNVIADGGKTQRIM